MTLTWTRVPGVSVATFSSTFCLILNCCDSDRCSVATAPSTWHCTTLAWTISPTVSSSAASLPSEAENGASSRRKKGQEGSDSVAQRPPGLGRKQRTSARPTSMT